MPQIHADAQSAQAIAISRPQARRLAELLKATVPNQRSSQLAWDDDRFWLSEASPEDRSQFFAIGNAMNFRFWSLCSDGLQPSEGVLDGERLVGSMYMWRRLRLVLQRGEFELLDAHQLAELTGPVLRRLLADDQGTHPLEPGFEERLENLRDLGRMLVRNWHGSFHNLVRASGADLEQFFRHSSGIRAYDDPLRKLSTVNAIMHSGAELAHFSEPVPPAIDYHLAKQLLRFGVVQVGPALAADLTHSRLISTDEGMAIRNACLEVLNEVCQSTGLSGEAVDNFLWSNRVVCTEPIPNCHACPLRGACDQLIELQRPLELTRYY